MWGKNSGLKLYFKRNGFGEFFFLPIYKRLHDEGYYFLKAPLN